MSQPPKPKLFPGGILAAFRSLFILWALFYFIKQSEKAAEKAEKADHPKPPSPLH